MSSTKENGRVAEEAALLVGRGEVPTVRAIAARLAPIGNSTVAAALREWCRLSLLPSMPGRPPAPIAEEGSERRVAVRFEDGHVDVFLADSAFRTTPDDLARCLAETKRPLPPSRGGGILVSFLEGRLAVRLTAPEYAFVSGLLAARDALDEKRTA